MNKLLFFLVLMALFSCQKEPIKQRYITYQELLDGMVLDCPSDTSSQFFKATINGQPTCYYNGVDGRSLYFSFSTRFTTPSPSISTGELPTNVRRGARLSIWHSPRRQGEDYIEFSFPDFAINRDSIKYLDSLFAIEFHPVKSNTEESDKFNVELRMLDLVTETGGIGYPISSKFGDQTGSFVRFRKVEKYVVDGVTSYDIEMEVECNLYHWSQNGQEGLWGRIEDGLFVGTLVVD